MIEIKDKSKCCGCSSCANICPKQCINMSEDTEGFLYPVVDKKKCIDCNLCINSCPELNLKEEKQFKQDGYLVQIKDDEIRKESTAGGAFTAIARFVIKNNGVVFGVTMDENFYVHHTYVEREEGLAKFRNSKYVQSAVGELTLKKVKEFLLQERLVCFSGTPCQIEGLKCFLKRDYENLITVDVVCRAVPSPLVFRKYVEFQNKKLDSKIVSVRFRDKFYGYKYSTMNIKTLNNNGKYHKGIESDLWLRTFFSEICDRPSCHSCSFRKRYRESDFTIWDCFNVGSFSKKMDDDKGTTRMLVNSEKGRNLFKDINEYINFEGVDSDKLVYGVKELTESVKPNRLRKEFMNDLNILSTEKLFNKYFPNTMKVRVERVFRLTIYKLGIYSLIKNLYVKLKNKIK